MKVTKLVSIPGKVIEHWPKRDTGSLVRNVTKLSAALLLAAAAATAPAPALSAGDPVAGANAFATYCSRCHGGAPSLPAYYDGDVAGLLQDHLVDLSERGVRIDAPGVSIDDIAAYLATLHNYSGLWWNGSESGWGLNLAHQGDVIFATWFTYDASGKGIWLAMSAPKVAPDTYEGTFYATTGPSYASKSFKVAQVAAAEIGSGKLTFAADGNGRFEYKLGDVVGAKSITRYAFGKVPRCGRAFNTYTARNYQDLWWAAPGGSEAGWGVHLTHQGDTIFVTFFTYDMDGSPMWLVATAPKTTAGSYEGKLYRTTGPAYSAKEFDPAAVTATEVGSVGLEFPDGNDGTFNYTVNGTSQAKAITREVFSKPGTVCR